MATLKIKDEQGRWIIAEDPAAIKYTRTQNISQTQQQTARENIGAMAKDKITTTAADAGKIVTVDENGNLHAAVIAIGGSF